MAVTETTPSMTLEVRLRDLLLRARTVKSSTSINPPLSVSELVPGNEDIFSPTSSDKQSLVAFETAARNIFYGLLVG